MRKSIHTYKNRTKQPSRKRYSKWRKPPISSTNSSACNRIKGTKITVNGNSIKGISVLSFLKSKVIKNCHAGMTVEAAIVLPVFLFFLLNLLWIIQIYSLHSTLLSSLREVGRELSVYAYAYDSIVNEEDDTGLEAFIEDVAFSYLYVKGRVESLAGTRYLDASPLTYGKDGLIYLESSILQEDDIIDLVVTYRVSPFINMAGYRSGIFFSRYYGRAWTGYDVDKENKEGDTKDYVYVAENAEVYHLNRECSHIRLSIAESSMWEIQGLYNNQGEKYLPCKLCVTYGQDRIYITVNGNRYHQKLECSGLKRTITQMLRWKAEEKYRMCSRCGR